MTFYMFQDANKQWRWHLVAANGRIIANSGEGYHNKNDCQVAVGMVMDTTRQTPFREK